MRAICKARGILRIIEKLRHQWPVRGGKAEVYFSVGHIDSIVDKLLPKRYRGLLADGLCDHSVIQITQLHQISMFLTR